MLKKPLIGLVFIFAAVCIYAAQQPDDFKVTRSAVINAPASEVFAQVNDLHSWDAWSPWAKLDPNATNSFEGPDAGVGAKMNWDGNMDVGKGSMTITDSQDAARVAFDLEFIKPLQGTNTAEFTFKEEDGKTQVTWSMEGKKNFPAKVMGLVFNCEKIVGEQFDQGLANLKNIIETR